MKIKNITSSIYSDPTTILSCSFTHTRCVGGWTRVTGRDWGKRTVEGRFIIPIQEEGVAQLQGPIQPFRVLCPTHCSTHIIYSLIQYHGWVEMWCGCVNVWGGGRRGKLDSSRQHWLCMCGGGKKKWVGRNFTELEYGSNKKM